MRCTVFYQPPVLPYWTGEIILQTGKNFYDDIETVCDPLLNILKMGIQMFARKHLGRNLVYIKSIIKKIYNITWLHKKQASYFSYVTNAHISSAHWVWE